MRVVVTGGAGFIGSHVADRLLELGHEVIVVDDLSSGSLANVPRGARLELLDLSGRSAAARIRSLRAELAVHCAAQASVARSAADPGLDARANILGTIALVQGALLGGASRLVYLNTGGALYGDAERVPTPEDASIQPLSPYGLSKWMAEQYLYRLVEGRAIATTLRLANVYGPRQRADGEGGVVSVFLDRMRSGGPIELHGDGDQTRDFVYVQDVVDAVVTAATTDVSVVANIGTGVATSINSVLRLLGDITGYEGPVSHVASRPGDVRHSSLEVARAAAVLGWRPTTDLAVGLRATADAPRPGDR